MSRHTTHVHEMCLSLCGAVDDVAKEQLETPRLGVSSSSLGVSSSSLGVSSSGLGVSRSNLGVSRLSLARSSTARNTFGEIIKT